MEDLPAELLANIIGHLCAGDALTLAFASRRMMAVCAAVLREHVTDVRVTFEEGACTPLVSVEPRGSGADHELSLSLCQCPAAHAMLGHVELLGCLMPIIAANVQRVVVEDYFLLKSSFIGGRTLEGILAPLAAVEQTGGSLRWLEMHNVDLSMAGPRSVLLIGKMHSLGQLAVVECAVRVPLLSANAFEERVFAAMVQCTLVDLQLTANQYVTDRFLRYVSRVCARLESADFAGCRSVTARGVAHFAEAIGRRRTPIMALKLRNTSVCSAELQMHLCHESSPAAKQGPWRVTQLDCCSELGNRAGRATLMHSARHTDKKIMLYA